LLFFMVISLSSGHGGRRKMKARADNGAARAFEFGDRV